MCGLYIVLACYLHFSVCAMYLAKTNKDNDETKGKASSWLNLLE